MTDEDHKLIRKIVAGGGRKYTAGNIDRRKYDRLVDLDFLTSTAANMSDIEYQVTETGQSAAVKNGIAAEGEKVSAGGTGAHVDFKVPAILRKWPSLNNECRT
jgi:hypothetical protein